jgi:Fe2+ transport system protein B
MIENTSGKENDIYSYSEDISRKIAAERIRFSEEVYKKSVQTGNTNYNKKRITADKIICSRFPGILIMLLLFAFIIFPINCLRQGSKSRLLRMARPYSRQEGRRSVQMSR